MRTAACIKRAFLKEPRWPGNDVALGYALLFACFVVMFGWFTGPHGDVTLKMMVAVATTYVLLGVAETLPRRRRGTTVALRVAGYSVIPILLALLAVGVTGFFQTLT